VFPRRNVNLLNTHGTKRAFIEAALLRVVVSTNVKKKMLALGRLFARSVGSWLILAWMFCNALGRPEAIVTIKNPCTTWNTQKRAQSLRSIDDWSGSPWSWMHALRKMGSRMKSTASATGGRMPWMMPCTGFGMSLIQFRKDTVLARVLMFEMTPTKATMGAQKMMSAIVIPQLISVRILRIQGDMERLSQRTCRGHRFKPPDRRGRRIYSPLLVRHPY
jgi:hypothetical protein